MAEDNNKNVVENSLETSNKVKGAVKTGKALSNIAKGASTGGPYGAIASTIWENRETVKKVVVSFSFLLLLPILYIMMLPSIIFNGVSNPSSTDILNNDVAIRQNITEAQSIVSDVLLNNHDNIIAQINAEIEKLGENEEAKIVDAYADGGYENIFILLSQYSAYKEDYREINLKDLEKTLKNNSNNLYYYTTTVTTSIREVEVETRATNEVDTTDSAEDNAEDNASNTDNNNTTTKQIEITTYTYTVQYEGVEHFSSVFDLDEKQQIYATEYANNLMIYLYGTNILGGVNGAISPEVYKYDALIRQYAEIYGVQDFIEVIYAIMMTESGGRVVDVMQSSECGYNTKYPNEPNGITDSEYSIDVGIHYFADCLNLANCTDVKDLDKLSLALQGYNFGTGYITWAKNKYGSYSESNAIEFSNIQKAKLGWSSYGNTKYVSKVMSYYYPLTASGVAGFGSPITTLNWKAYVTSEFGTRKDPFTGEIKSHDGLDVGVPIGTPLNAVNDGTVISVDMGSGYGTSLLIDHGNGIVSGYAHCSELLVSSGQVVKKGQVIALSGNSGRSTGPHLHFEIRLNGVKTNTREYIN